MYAIRKPLSHRGTYSPPCFNSTAPDNPLENRSLTGILTVKCKASQIFWGNRYACKKPPVAVWQAGAGDLR